MLAQKLFLKNTFPACVGFVPWDSCALVRGVDKRVVFRNGAFGGCSPGTKTRTRVHSKVPEGHHPRGTTLREALRGKLPLRGLHGGLSEGSAGVSPRVLRGSRGILRGFPGVVTLCLRPSGTVGYIGMFPWNENRNKGTFACFTGMKTRTRVHSPIPPFLRNRPFVSL